ncbi:translation initiation factor IF-2 [Pantherophis guttatus]|uniref:Translation initiation factor IF-2 n=1 Tax=Pantherophis guttatus TaxID=94885 RepID=A0ABM3YQE6_PANGU|nr:translation initiation factor IF-2 [Pantherophis guttatus]
MGGPEERGGPGRGAPKSLEPGGGQRLQGQPKEGGGGGEEGDPRGEEPGRRLDPKRSELRDVGTQVSWAPGGGASGGGEGRSRTAGEDPQAKAGDLRGAPGRWGAPPALWGAASVAPGSQSKTGQDKRASWPGGLCEGCGAPKEGVQPRKGGAPRLHSHRAWDLGSRDPRDRLEDSMGLLALGVSRSLSGGLPGHAGAKRDSGGWLQKEWPRDPTESSGQVWVPRKPGRAPERTMGGLPWLKEGAVPRKSGAAELNQVWIPREKPAPPGGGGSGDVWVHKVRNPSGTGIMWVWAKVTNCSEEEAVNEASIWTFQKEGPRKGGEGEGGYGVS